MDLPWYRESFKKRKMPIRVFYNYMSSQHIIHFPRQDERGYISEFYGKSAIKEILKSKKLNLRDDQGDIEKNHPLLIKFLKKIQKLNQFLAQKKISATDYHVKLLGEKMRFLKLIDKDNIPKINIYVDAVEQEKYPKELEQIM